MSLDPTQQTGSEQSQSPTEPAGPKPQGLPTGPAQAGPYYEYTPFNASPPPYGPPPAPPGYLLQGFYSAPQGPSYGTPLPPLRLIDAIEQLPLHYWKVLRKPHARAFAEESGRATWSIVLAQLIGYTILDALLSWLHTTLYPITVGNLAAMNANRGIDVTKVVEAEIAIVNFMSGPGLFFAVPLGFFIYQGIAFGLAKAFGGQGTFLSQSHATLLIYVPIGIITIALSYVPLGIISSLLSLALEVYGIVLAVFAMMGAHRLTSGKAAAVALLPLLGLLLLACCGFFIALFPAISSAVPPQ